MDRTLDPRFTNSLKDATMREPEFSLYEFVTFNGIKAKIVKRFYDIDEELYLYELSGIQGLHSGNALQPFFD